MRWFKFWLNFLWLSRRISAGKMFQLEKQYSWKIHRGLLSVTVIYGNLFQQTYFLFSRRFSSFSSIKKLIDGNLTAQRISRRKTIKLSPNTISPSRIKNSWRSFYRFSLKSSCQIRENSYKISFCLSWTAPYTKK